MPGGSPRGSASSSTCRTCMSSSRCRTRCCRSAIATPRSCTPGSFRRVRPRCARSPPTRVTSARRSASSASSTRGGRRWSGIRTCTASCRPAACRPITSDGFVRRYAGFFLPVKVLSRVFRGKFVAALRRAYARGDLDLAGATERLRDPAQWHAFVDALFETDWVVYAKPAFGGASAVLRYLGRYTHRVAISNHRLIAFDGERVTFQWKDYAHGESVAHDDAHRDGVSPALRAARAAARLRPHSAVWLSRQRLSHRAPRARPALTPTALRHARRRPRHRRPGTVRDAERRWSSARSSPRSSWPRSPSASTPHEHPATSSRPASSSTWSPTCQEWCVSIRACPVRRVAPPGPYARRPDCVPPPLARRRPLDRRRPTLEDPDSSSIAGRRASGFLQVSLSKVPRHQHRAHVPALAPRHFR